MMPVRPSVLALAATALIAVAGCSSSNAPKPTPLGPEPTAMRVATAWSSRVGPVQFPLQVGVSKGRVGIASSDGTVALIDARTGADVWRSSAGAPLTAGVGTDGQTAAVVTILNEVVALGATGPVWRYRLATRSFTAPLVAGGRVFVLGADRSVTALDGETGRRLWVQTRPQSENLVVQQAGALLAIGNTLVAGFSGRLTGMNPANGSTVWEGVFAASRAANDIERLIDVVGPVSRVADSVCARAFQNAVGCIDAKAGHAVWTKNSAGVHGVGGDEQRVYGSESDGTVVAYSRARGEKLWSVETLRFRDVGAPVATAQAVVVADGQGYVHWLGRTDGEVLSRMQADPTGVAVAPVSVDGRVIIVGRSGQITAFATP